MSLSRSLMTSGSYRRHGRRVTLAESTEATMDPRFSDYKPIFSTEESPGLLASIAAESTALGGWRDPEFRRRWGSLGIVYMVNFLLVIQNSLYWPSLWPYLSQIDPSAGESFFGYVIMAFNLGSAIASPMFGYWSNRIQQTRIPIVVGILITMTGNLLLAFVEAFDSNRKWVLLVARFITGFGLGNQGSLYAYVAMASTLKERNKAVSLRAAVNSLGLMLGPAMQAAFVPIGYPGFTSGNFAFNMYTAPAYTNIALGIIQVILMLTVFQECWVSVDDSQLKQTEEEESRKLKPFDTLAVVVSIYIRLVILFCYTYDTTIGSPFTMAMFGWTRAEAVSKNSMISMSMAALNLGMSLLVGMVLLKYVRERVFTIIGLCSFITFYLLSFPWPGLPLLAPPNDGFSGSTSATTSGSLFANTSTYLVPVSTEEPTGCNYKWCAYTTKVSLPAYIVGYGCMVLAFAVAYTPNATLFSKMLGPRKQGTMQGIFAAAGQAGMTISPLICSNLFEYFGPRVTWITGTTVLLSGVIVVLVMFKRLVPWQDYDDVGEDQPLMTSLEASVNYATSDV